MVDNIPPEEPEIELSGRQIEQLDAIDNAVYQTILTFLNKTEDEFPWDMQRMPSKEHCWISASGSTGLQS